jgi:virulence factor
VDTLRFLAPAPILRRHVETVVRDGLLESIVLMLSGADHQAIGTMHRASGLDEERVDIFGGDAKRSSVNLAEWIDADGAESVTRRGDWTPVSRQRGFEAMCAHFLAAVADGRATACDDLLETHALCERIVAHASAGPDAADGSA